MNRSDIESQTVSLAIQSIPEKSVELSNQIHNKRENRAVTRLEKKRFDFPTPMRQRPQCYKKLLLIRLTRCKNQSRPVCRCFRWDRPVVVSNNNKLMLGTRPPQQERMKRGTFLKLFANRLMVW